MAHMNLKILDLIRQQEAIRHKAVVIWKKSLEPADNDAKNVFLCKMLTKLSSDSYLHPLAGTYLSLPIVSL
jgi:hypothetical protein